LESSECGGKQQDGINAVPRTTLSDHFLPPICIHDRVHTQGQTGSIIRADTDFNAAAPRATGMRVLSLI
jgi:hypothetical protein